MTTRIDHFMYAVASLDDGIEWAADAFGVAPAYGGEHIGLGTRNALLSLGDTYLEIIAPDPAQDLSGNTGERFAQLSEGGLVTWAVQGDLNNIASVLSSRDVSTVGPHRTERKTAEGDVLVWELLFPTGSPYGPRMPFFIDWLDCAHPSATNPSAGEFLNLSISVPGGAALQADLAAIGLEVAVADGTPGLSIDIATANGNVTLASTAETSAITMR